jgi:PAS domain S-box-containing protein
MTTLLVDQQRTGGGLLPNGGEMGALIRQKDWSCTPFGPIDTWPQSLKTATGIMLESSFAMVVAWGPEFRFLYNDRYRPILGLKHPQSLGAPASEIFPEVWSSLIGPLFMRTRRGEAVALDDLLIPLNRHGYLENCYFTIAYSPIRDESGGVGGMLAVVAETTERVEGERRLLTLRDLARHAAYATSSREACVKAAAVLEKNPTDIPFALLYLCEADGATAQRVAAVGVPAGHDAGSAAIDLARDDPESWPLGRALREGQALVLDDVPTRFAPLPSGPYPEPVHTAMILPLSRPGVARPYGFLVAGVSARRRLDQRYRDFLELAAEHATTAIANARALEEERRRADALAEIDRAKTAFFSNVSHEFRTPLTLMLGPIEDVLARGNGALPPDVRAQLELTHRNSLRLLKLVNTLLDFSRLEAGRMRASYEPVDLPAFTAELASVFRAAIEKAGLRLVVDCSPASQPAYVDRDFWEKIVFNLLSNALKFTLAGEIAVRVRELPGRFELTVRDTGVGIEPGELPQLFTRFHRIPNARSRTHEGTGIGLALVQELARLHGGDVTVDSKPGAGTCFTVTLPAGKSHLPAERVGAARTDVSTRLGASVFVEEALRWLPDGHDQPAPANAPANAAGQARPRIVLADDNADMRDYVRRILSEFYAVEAVADGAAALDAIRGAPTDLVLADVMMPRLDGFGLLRALRSEPATQTLPVLLLSARAGNEASIEGFERGADDYLVKPFSTRELLARVASHLTMSRLRNEVRSHAAETRAADARSHQVLESMPAAACVCDAAGRITFFNPLAGQLLGRSPQPGQTWSDFTAAFKIHRADESLVPAGETPMAIAAREGRAFHDLELEIVRPDGSRFYAHANIRPLHDRDGRPAGAINVFQDISARKRRERDMARLTSLGQEIALLTDRGEILRAATRAVGQHLGVDRCHFAEPDANGAGVSVVHEWRREGPGSPDAEFNLEHFGGPAWREAFATRPLAIDDTRLDPLTRDSQNVQAAAREQAVALAPFVRDGRWVVTLVAANRAPRRWKPEELELLANVVARVWPLVERARVAADLRDSEERFRMVADNMAALAWTADRLGWATWYNQRWFDYTGTTFEDMQGRGWECVQHPDHVERVRAKLAACLESGEPWEDTFPLRSRDGDYRWFLSRAVPIRRDGRIVRWFGTNIDIHDLRSAQEALQHHTRTLEALNRAGTALLAEFDMEKIVQRVTDAGREISGAAFGAFFYNVKNERGESYMLYTLSGAPREAFAGFPMPRNTAIFAPTFNGDGPVRIADVRQDPRFGRNAPHHGMPAGHLPVRSYLAVPVKSRTGEVLGGLFYGHPECDVFTAEAEQGLVALAAEAAIAIDNAELHVKLQRELQRARQSEEDNRRLASIVQSTDDAIVSKDLNGIIASWNPGAQRMFGYSATEIVGQSIHVLIPPDRRHEEVEILSRIRRGERLEHYETVRRLKDGRLVDVSITVSPLRDETGRVVGASKIARNITERRRAEWQQRVLYDLVARVNRAEALPEIYAAALDAIRLCQNANRASILLFDAAGTMRFVASQGLSESYCRAVEGHSPWQRDDPDPRPVCIEDIATAGLAPELHDVIAREGIRSLAFIPLTYEKRLLGKFMMYFDEPHRFGPDELRPVETIASQVAFAIERRQSANALEALVTERTASLKQAIEQMEEFSYSVSHDLRSPVRAMRGYAEALLTDYGARLDEEGRDLLQRIERNGLRMDRLIQDLLTYTRLARRDMRMEPVSLDRLVREIIQHYPELRPEAATIEIRGPLPDVLAHEPSLSQVISNLLSNAVKFVSPGTHPHVRIGFEATSSTVRLWFQDNGIGIKREYQQRLFGMFERLHPEREYEGTGIGLAIVRKAMERMNGRVGMASDGVSGSRFWIELPPAPTP